MRKWLMIWILAVVYLTACSDDKDAPVVDTDPFLPVTQLEIPKRQLVGTDITICGKGFDAECSVFLQLNGGDTFSAEIVEVGGDSLVLRPSGELEAGFYIIILKKGDKQYRIGGINLHSDSLNLKDMEAYAVGKSSDGLGFYPVSVSKQLKGELLFSIGGAESEFYGGLVIGPTFYHASFVSRDVFEDPFTRVYDFFTIGSYDLESGEQETLMNEERGLVGIGNIDGLLHIIQFDKAENLYRLKKWEDGEFIEIKSFTAGGTELIRLNSGVFLHDASRNTLLMGVFDMAGLTESFAWKLDMSAANWQLAKFGGTSDIDYNFIPCGEDIYVAGARSVITDEDIGIETYTSYIFKPQDPSNWSFNSGNLISTFENSLFISPCYNADKEVIYLISEDDQTINTYDIQKEQLTGGKWVNSGIYGLFIFNNNN